MTDENKPVSKKPLQVSKAPPPITPLRGGGYSPKPSTNDRLPRWSKWRLMPTVKEWEAVALSLNIEPGKVKTNSSAWMDDDPPYDEGDEFNDRLEILNKHASNRTHFPTPCTLNMGNWYLCEVRLDEFAAWCAHVGFAIPPELAALAKAAPQQAGAITEEEEGFNFGYYSEIASDHGSVYWKEWRLSYWTPREAACLMVELDPKHYDSVKSSRSQQDRGLADYVDATERMATREQESGLLPDKASPSKWVEWAQSKGRVVPDQLHEIARAELPDAPAAKGGAGTIAAPTKTKMLAQTWWRAEYEIMTMAQSAGDSLRRKGKRPSNRAIGDAVALEIEQREKSGKKRKGPDGQTIKNADLLGWKYEAE